jgi:uncharacterized protein (TIGR03792 family)
MVIEWLTFEVPIEWHDRYIQADAEIWTPFLQSCPGYVGKQVWRSPDHRDQLTLIIQWETRAQWKAIAPTKLAALDRQFVARLGQAFVILEAREYNPLTA